MSKGLRDKDKLKMPCKTLFKMPTGGNMNNLMPGCQAQPYTK